MHLRGPMNVSQLAVYQLPNEVRTMEKRNTVPFYNRRRSLKQAEASVAADTTTVPAESTTSSWMNLFNKWACGTTSSCVSTLVTQTVTVKAVCSSTSTAQFASSTTAMGPPLPYMPPAATTLNVSFTSPEPDCPCDKDEDLDNIFQRPNGQAYVSPIHGRALAPSSTGHILPVSQHPDGQPFDYSPTHDHVPTPAPSSTQDILPVSQHPDGQPFDVSPTNDHVPKPSSTQEPLPVSQRPDGQPFVISAPEPAPAPSSTSELLPVSQHIDGQPFVVGSAPKLGPVPSSTQGTLPVSQHPDGQPFDVPNPSSSPIVKRQATDWRRVAYYTSTAPAQATGLTFMANLGDPQKSGTFD
jgi:hypothetical protein